MRIKKMSNVDEREWKEFYISDIVNSFNSNAYHSENLEFNDSDEYIAYITRTANQNGLYGFADNDGKEYKINPSNTISYGAETAEFYYQQFPYITGNKMYYLSSERMSKYLGLFLVTELRKGIKSCFSYANGAIPDRVMRKKIMLPIDSKGKPDYVFMEKLIKEKEKHLQDEYRKYCIDVVRKLGKPVEITQLSQKDWREFFIDDIFSISSGKRLESYNMTVGNTPFIGATDSGNGITNYISNVNDSLDENVLGVNYNGNGMVISFYHPYKCLFSDDVKRFHLKNYDDNKFVLLFFKTIILQQKSKYNYGYKFNETRMKRQKIKVPVNKDKKPDYEYMEQYIKNKMILMYNRYLDYKK